MMKDNIDFGNMSVARLFRKLLLPTLLGMVFSVLFVITDGMFVGNGIGSDALAAVNIVAPLFLISSGIGLMFGVGASVVMSIHLSRNNPKTARINMTQALAVLSLLLVLLGGFVWFHTGEVALLLGCSDLLLPQVEVYMRWCLPFFVFHEVLASGMFFVRLDGSPNYAMWCNVVPALINIVLDYVFIFVFRWGMMGAALATGIGYVVGAVMVLAYLLWSGHTLRLIRVKTHGRSLRMTVRNVGYMCRMGTSSCLSEMAIAVMMFVGNGVFIRYLAEDGVAAFSIACYFFPIIFMIYAAVAQSVQPILSYNYGAGRMDRVRSAFRLSLFTVIGFGTVVWLLTVLFSPAIVHLFIKPVYPAYDIAVKGLPLFASGFVFFGVSMVSIGYYQSLERDRPAIFFTLMRGFVLVVACFCCLPPLWGVPGIWLAVPVAEFLTFLFLVGVYCSRRK